MPSPEVSDASVAFLETLAVTPPTAPTACTGWTTHELIAHLAAGAAEMAELIEDRLAGRPVRPTRGFAEREAPYRALEDEELRGRLITQALRFAQALEDLERAPDSAVAFTGQVMDTPQLRRHAQSEAALHRWDLAGSDEVSMVLLADPSLTQHAIDVLNTMSSLDESLAKRTSRAAAVMPEGFCARLSSPGNADVVLYQDGGMLRFDSEPESGGEPTLVCDPATRLLLLWGRRSPDASIETVSASEGKVVEAVLRVPST